MGIRISEVLRKVVEEIGRRRIEMLRRELEKVGSALERIDVERFVKHVREDRECK